jgi:hypothetical protein
MVAMLFGFVGAQMVVWADQPQFLPIGERELPIAGVGRTLRGDRVSSGGRAPRRVP